MIIKAIRSTLDYCLFTFGFIVAVQLPEFIQQYQQFLAGKLSEAKWHLQGYQKIADSQFNGDLQAMINEYLKNSSDAIKQTGELIAEQVVHVTQLTNQVEQLMNPDYLTKIWYFVNHINTTDAQTVISYYQLAIPLTIESLFTGITLAFILVWLRLLLTSLITAIFGFRDQTLSHH